MQKGILYNDIELGYSAISAYHLSLLTRDKNFYKNVIDSHLYIIVQRKEITFHKFSFSNKRILKFEIHQEGISKIIACELPLNQESFKLDFKKEIQLRTHDRRNTLEKQIQYPFDGIQAFSILERDVLTQKSELAVWFSPDKLFYHHWKGNLYAQFSDDYQDMLNYKIHYVGKSTEQNICKRLSNHSTFQEILINETPFSFGNIPSNEIMVLLMRICDNNSIVSWGKEATPEEMADFILNYKLPSDKTVSLDAEKALIKHLQPHYNKILYHSFPQNNDLVNTDYHSVILYAFCDPISLIYNQGIIKGGKLGEERDFIAVERI
ncbi:MULTISPECIES: hypothetical protein [Chryseobacterium]|uniref:Uncharacterized protein n=1 Tax=Chryseobacterium limigenitum TaxID=1612149 RepID=A0A1K2ISR0_9FLAO|nr:MULTISPECIES: hypothetical protein [Chryseobacterium]MDQ0593399.1 hypothetical protein [Chryseobacterium ginsenosidimutans]SFZ95350.1 hypothetical protein SAMN05216324_10993 [Chryseobacterium limigenitum]VXC00227.1 conserved hypothetical protein [Chryseobacterium sp. 8AT]